MNDTMVTVIGNAATDVRVDTTTSGVPMASFRLATTPRRFDRRRDLWTNGETSFYTVHAWRFMAANVAGSVSRGDPVIVTGRLQVQDWEKDGKRHTVSVIDADGIGHDLSRGTTVFHRVSRIPREEKRDSTEPEKSGGRRALAALGLAPEPAASEKQGQEEQQDAGVRVPRQRSAEDASTSGAPRAVTPVA